MPTCPGCGDEVYRDGWGCWGCLNEKVAMARAGGICHCSEKEGPHSHG